MVPTGAGEAVPHFFPSLPCHIMGRYTLYVKGCYNDLLFPGNKGSHQRSPPTSLVL